MDCMKLAIQEVENLIQGESFLVKDLFKGYEWNRLTIGDRRSLGALFLHEVKYGELKERIEVGLKSSANQQQYIKK
ncbi:single-stranded DNA-binding protein [Cytobacillus praedii]|uniref:Single-stranded DNA-binding protein n=1 Tax=Cytobacillus praedii TaxID=1742358 RepID=A0A4R1ASE4_9BACI|nr:single-stranded DNA-binding protein [Cytobacillus praedii]TCJ00987.1 single-stranded DNA-binding protein [Cytobacillus praedii]